MPLLIDRKFSPCCKRLMMDGIQSIFDELMPAIDRAVCLRVPRQLKFVAHVVEHDRESRLIGVTVRSPPIVKFRREPAG
ncbi:hypothetical protein ACMHYB_07135 [Sorangium sp. So ce1128]